MTYSVLIYQKILPDNMISYLANRHGADMVITSVHNITELRAELKDPDKHQIVVVDLLSGDDPYKLLEVAKICSPDAPKVVVTYAAEPYEVCEAFRRGADDVIRTPIYIEELGLRIQAVLKRLEGKPVKEPDTYQIGKYYTFDVARSELTYKGPKGEDYAELTAKECELLRLLCERKGKVLTRDKTLGVLWNGEKMQNRTLDVFIKKLRTLLELDESVKIVSLVGIGHKLSF